MAPQPQGKSFSRGPGRGSPNQYQEPTTRLPPAKPFSYFTDEAKETIDANLLDQRAVDWAQSFGQALKTSQMRRFFDEIKAIQRKILTGQTIQEQAASFQKNRPLVVMFKAKAVYAEKRKVSPPEFTQFIFDNVASITDVKDFMAFTRVFEAVVAFHRYFSPEK